MTQLCVGISHKIYTRWTDYTNVKWKPKAYGRPASSLCSYLTEPAKCSTLRVRFLNFYANASVILGSPEIEMRLTC